MHGSIISTHEVTLCREWPSEVADGKEKSPPQRFAHSTSDRVSNTHNAPNSVAGRMRICVFYARFQAAALECVLEQKMGGVIVTNRPKEYVKWFENSNLTERNTASQSIRSSLGNAWLSAVVWLSRSGFYYIHTLLGSFCRETGLHMTDRNGVDLCWKYQKLFFSLVLM